MDSSTYVVIGAGLTGAATAWRLARRGHEVTVVERTEPATPDGSSHGSARIFRYAYSEQFWVDLVVCARAGFTELERLSGQQLITPTGSLDFGRLRDPAALSPLLAAAGVEHEVLSAEQARARWPQIAVDTEVLWHPAAGVIDAQNTVHAMLAAAAGHGAWVLTRWPVRGIEKTATGYRVAAQDGRGIHAERVVVAAGGWLPDLLDRLPLPGGFRAAIPPLQVSQENAYHFPYRDQSVAWPTFIHKNSAIQTTACPAVAMPTSAGRSSPSTTAASASVRQRRRTAASTRTTRRGSSTTSSGTCRAWSPSRTPPPRACSPTPRTRTSSSTASTASP